ncbi:hypothetical protein ADUPG1_004924 [Aduncisulcus paluster]|uniref:Uncharacterized protein n=1 Tax=Aduncisulcus paluster TaxID=2918883 RepID=A0ABQ5K746_9EUKA|nr:hypothetical protein ADUPG1_004924 [Aduncisulcus paluster]
MSSSTKSIQGQIVRAKFIHEGYLERCPIRRDAPNVIEFSYITAGDYDASIEANKIMKGEEPDSCPTYTFSQISIPFSFSSSIKGAYILIYYRSYPLPPTHLTFTFSSSKGEKISKIFEFPEYWSDDKLEYKRLMPVAGYILRGPNWFFLPIDISDVEECEITGSALKRFSITSLVFFRKKTHKEILALKARAIQRHFASIVKPKFVHEGDWKSRGRDSIPIARDDPTLVDPSFSMVKCKNASVSKESEYYDMSSNAKKMLKGECSVCLSHLSIPFPSPSPLKGAYICVDAYYGSPSLLFTFTDSDGKKTSKKYEFTRPKHCHEWHFLPIDLCNVVLCEIEGKGRWCNMENRYFYINSLVFFRNDELSPSIPLLTPSPSSLSKRKKLSKPIQIVEPEFIGRDEYDGSPVKWDSPNIQSADFSTLQAIDGTRAEGTKYFQSDNVQKMMKGEYHQGQFTHISIPFSFSSPIKGAYIYTESYYSSAPRLLFTFTSSKGEITPKRYDFPDSWDHWYFLPIDLSDVVLCEITGKGREYENFGIKSLVFFRKEISLISQKVKPEFFYEGNEYCCPISREAPNVKRVDFSSIEAGGFDCNMKLQAQNLMNGGSIVRELFSISIPFSSSSPMKGAYICLSGDAYDLPPAHLFFSLRSSKGEKTIKTYKFPEFKGRNWYFLPVDLSDVVLCRITGRGRDSVGFKIGSLVFISREGIPDYEAKKKLWSEVPVVKPEFVKEGNRDSIPIPRDDPKLVDPLFSMVKGLDDLFSKKSKWYDLSSNAKKMLKGECSVCLSHLSIPFPSPSPLKGAYICVDKDFSSPSLLFTFTDCDGKKTSKKYEFTRPKHIFEWHFLPIDLYNVVLCEIEGKGTWNNEKSRLFCIESLVFTAIPEEIIAAERLPQLPWK